LNSNDLAEQQRVVACGMDRVMRAVEDRQCIAQDRRAVGINAVVEIGKLLFPRSIWNGEMIGQMGLFIGEDMHGEAFGLDEDIVCLCIVRHIETNQRRIERDAGEGADGDTTRFVVSCDRHHRHWRGHPAHGGAERMAIELLLHVDLR